MNCDCKKVSSLLKTARGQIEGILKMIDDNRYCIDVMNQILATQAVLKKANSEILKGHMHTCVAQAFESSNEEEKDKKINEIIALLDRTSK